MKSRKDKILNIRKIKQQVKGITLIALVVTIIVLLILAGVALNLTIGQNGIFTRAQDAANTWKNAEANEQLALEEGADIINSYLNGGSTEGDQTGTTVVDDVPIPDRFYYVGGTKESGLVISDAKEDENKYKGQTEVPADGLIGNQFVWIPVDNSSEEKFNKVFQRQEGYSSGSKQSYLSSCGEADSTGVNSKVTETATTQAEAIAMYDSIYENGGFYVGRYEVGKDKDGTVVIKKGTEDNPVNPYTNIKWSSNGSMQETAGTTGGAVEISRNFDTANNYTSVNSTLIYGVQWDAIMNFIDLNYITNATIGNPSCATNSFVRNSTDKGYYNQSSPTICGSSDSYRVNNIYDLAGNVFEWTMESYSSFNRFFRGGGCSGSGSGGPASYRGIHRPGNTNDYIGLRVALYVQ